MLTDEVNISVSVFTVTDFMHVWLSYVNILHHMLKQEAFSRLSNMKNIFTPSEV